MYMSHYKYHGLVTFTYIVVLLLSLSIYIYEDVCFFISILHVLFLFSLYTHVFSFI